MGGLFALGGGWLQSWLAAKRERAQKLHDLRVTVYTEASVAVENLDEKVKSWTNFDNTGDLSVADEKHRNWISARIRMVAPRAVRTAWFSYVETEGAFRSMGTAGSLTQDSDGSVLLDDPFLVSMQNAMKSLQRAMGSDLGVQDLD